MNQNQISSGALTDMLLDAMNDLNTGISVEEILSRFSKTDEEVAALNLEADNLADLFNMTEDEMSAEFNSIADQMKSTKVNSLPTFVQFCSTLSKRQMLIFYTKVMMDLMSHKIDNLKSLLEEKLSNGNIIVSFKKKSIQEKIELLEERFEDEIKNDKLTKKIFEQLKKELDNDESES